MTTAIDYGTEYLAKLLAFAVREHISEGGTGKIGVYDPDQQVFEPTLTNITEAAGHASQIDGFVVYRVGGATFQVIYDGPYEDWDQAEEIIQDCNGRAGILIEMFNGIAKSWQDESIESIFER